MFFFSVNKTFASQNHKRLQPKKDHWRSCGPALLLKRGHQQPVVHDCLQTSLEYLQGGLLCHLPGQPVPVLSPLTVKRYVLIFIGNILCFNCFWFLHWASSVYSVGNMVYRQNLKIANLDYYSSDERDSCFCRKLMDPWQC